MTATPAPNDAANGRLGDQADAQAPATADHRLLIAVKTAPPTPESSQTNPTKLSHPEEANAPTNPTEEGTEPRDHAPLIGTAHVSDIRADTTAHSTETTLPEATATTTTPAADLDAVRRARAYLLRVAEPPAPALAAFVAQVGAVTAAEMVRAGTVPPTVLEQTVARKDMDLAEADLAKADEIGARLLIPEDDEWPAWPFAALDLASARGVRWAGHPIALWAKGTGHLGDLTERAVAVVGSRAATAYGEHVATEFGYELAASGLTVVSGAAYGIDGTAHRGAIAADGPTVAVLACGVDQPYPLGHANLLRQVAEHGLVLSEYPPTTPPAKHRFLVRNRLIAASSAGTVVIEAGRRSGARNTAATAQALGRVVLAVPGSVTSAMSVGCHELIRSGDAYLVSNAAEVMESIGRIGTDLTEPVPQGRRPTDQLDAQQLRVHEALARRKMLSPEQISVGSGVPLERVRAALPLLELAGLAEHRESGWCRSTQQRGGAA